jgi:Protein of unknown function (DUF3553)
MGVLCHSAKGRAWCRRHRPAREADMQEMLAPGALVRHPDEPDWGLGQVQTVIGSRVTVNFEHAGKRLINSDVVRLELVASERDF